MSYIDCSVFRQAYSLYLVCAVCKQYCYLQRPEGFTFWFSEAQSEYHPASQRSLQSCLKFIDGKQGTQTPFGRKRSRLSSLD